MLRSHWKGNNYQITVVIIGGSRGGREGRTPPPGRPNSFDFMQFSGKFGVFTPPLEGSRPPLGKILDPPLVMLSENPYYLPQRSCGKLMFLHLCVILFTGVVSVHGGLCPGELCPAGGGGSVQGEVSIQRVFVQQRVLCPETPPWTETPRTVTCGRFASYRNAFLFVIMHLQMRHLFLLTVH